MVKNDYFKNKFNKSNVFCMSWVPINFLIFSHLDNTIDPEYPIILSDLGILKLEYVEILNYSSSYITIVKISFFPTFGQCKLAPLVGISLLFFIQSKITMKKIIKSYHKSWLLFFKINLDKNNHTVGENITRQLNDTERLSAALENSSIRSSALKCIKKAN